MGAIVCTHFDTCAYIHQHIRDYWMKQKGSAGTTHTRDKRMRTTTCPLPPRIIVTYACLWFGRVQKGTMTKLILTRVGDSSERRTAKGARRLVFVFVRECVYAMFMCSSVRLGKDNKYEFILGTEEKNSCVNVFCAHA